VSHSPEHAIQEWLADPGLKETSGEAIPFRVLAETISPLKRRASASRQLWYVTCEAEDQDGQRQPWHWIVETSLGEFGRWKAHGVAGGSGSDLPRKGFPWANLGGGWGRTGLLAGGTVEDAGNDVRRVRLTDAKGNAMEDAVDDGIVLFISDEPVAMPMRVDLYDAAGHVVATHDWGFVEE
jgi:hypothetical protein